MCAPRILFSAFLLFLIFVGMQPAKAQVAPRVLASQLQELMDVGRYDEARALVKTTFASAPEAALHYGHFEGLILVHQGRYEDAIKTFRTVLEVAPNFLPSRVELAKLLYRTGQTDAATYHFQAISLGHDDIGLRRLAESYMAQIRADRPYGFSGYFSLLPSTNINRGTDAQFFRSLLGPGLINLAARRQSGVGFAAGANAFRRFDVGEASSFMLSGAVDGKKYTMTSAYDEFSVSSSLLYLREFDKLTFRIGPTAEYKLVAWQPYLGRYGATAGVTIAAGNRTTIDLGVTALRQGYASLTYRDGWLWNGSATARHMFSPSLSVSLTAGFSAERTQRPHLDHNDFRVMVQADKEWSGGLMTSTFGTYEKHRYLGNYPLTLSTRVDDMLSIGIRLAHRKIAFKGFAPQLKYEYTRQISNVSFFDYQSHDIGLSVTKRY